MNAFARLLAPAAVLMSVAAFHPPPAGAAVAVSFPNGEQATDGSLRYDKRSRAEARVQRDIRQYLEELGERHLAAGQVLTIDVLDIDLAGERKPWRTLADDVRILRRDAWPRIRLRYTFQEQGRTVLSAEETVRDQYYLENAMSRLSTDPLRYEKAMLKDWFRERFVERRPAAG